MTIHLGHRFPGGSSGYPAPRRATCERSLFALHRAGFGEPPCRHDAGGLLPHRFTLTGRHLRRRAGRRSALCSTFRRLSPPGVSPAPLPFGVRTFLGPPCGPRPPGLRAQCSPRQAEPSERRRSPRWDDAAQPPPAGAGPARSRVRRSPPVAAPLRPQSPRRHRPILGRRRRRRTRRPRRADSSRPAVASWRPPRPRPSALRAPSRRPRRSFSSPRPVVRRRSRGATASRW